MPPRTFPPSVAPRGSRATASHVVPASSAPGHAQVPAQSPSVAGPDLDAQQATAVFGAVRVEPAPSSVPQQPPAPRPTDPRQAAPRPAAPVPADPRAAQGPPSRASGPRTTRGAAAGPVGGTVAVRRYLGELEPAVVVLGGVVLMLVVTAVVMAFVVLGGGGSGGAAAAPEPSSTTSHQAAAAPVKVRFASPSRNITCAMSKDAVTCDIADLAKTPAPVDGCEGTVGYVATLDAAGKVGAPCAASRPAAAPSSVSVLAYGKQRSAGPFTCHSTREGVRCTEKSSGKGFTIAKAGIGSF
ncbi:hypothetical protein [Luteimicrobium subarcticum]|uniref:hypothetical protein n=1 Tax=Luteimicrobium subarcticum TaxID=620910 RepID=UPI0012FDEF50|nr:hypothetical protein [Luteimicrobium subarcticum]